MLATANPASSSGPRLDATCCLSPSTHPPPWTNTTSGTGLVASGGTHRSSTWAEEVSGLV